MSSSEKLEQVSEKLQQVSEQLQQYIELLKRNLNSAGKILEDIYADPTFTDFTFDVQGKEFKLHKNILAAASPVMKKMFQSEFYEEAKTNRCIITDIEPEIFEKLIRFIYVGGVPEGIDKEWMDLAEAAHYYEMVTLLEICETKLKDFVSEENCLEIFGKALKLELKNLIKTSWELIQKRYKIEFDQPLDFAAITEIVEMRKREAEIFEEHSATHQKM